VKQNVKNGKKIHPASKNIVTTTKVQISIVSFTNHSSVRIFRKTNHLVS